MLKDYLARSANVSKENLPPFPFAEEVNIDGGNNGDG